VGDPRRSPATPTAAAVPVDAPPCIPDRTDILAAALALETGLSAVYVRREPKGYGTAKLAEGADVDGRRVVIVEDVISTGGQVAMSAGQLRGLGAIVDDAICVVDRSGGEHPLLDEAGITLHVLFTADEVAQPGVR
jgi:orotate phosphoribosyltransferase